MKDKVLKISYKVLLILISTLFIFMGIEKILIRPEMVESFRIFGLPKEFMVIIGFTELVLGVILLSRYFTKIALHGLITILTFATFLHLMNYQYLLSLVPIGMIFLMILTLNMGQKVRNINQ